MSKTLQLAIVATHPIQYHLPWYQGLSKHPDVNLKVFYAFLPNEQQQGAGFGESFNWDLPLLEGYSWELLDNQAKVPSLENFWGCNVPKIGERLSSWGADVVLVTGWNAFALLQAIVASKRLRLPLLVRGESNAMRPRVWWKKLTHRLLVGRFDAVLAIGRASREFYCELGYPSGKIFDTPYFVDNMRFRDSLVDMSEEMISQLRDRFSIPCNITCFIYSGKLNYKKRIMDLLRACTILSEKGIIYHLLVVGAGELKAQAEAYATKNELKVTFTGFLNQSEIPLAYHASDCLVLPSDFGETWGLVVNEAMACGKPAIVSDRVGCGPDLVEDGITGYRFSFGSYTELAHRMERMIEDLPRCRRMGEAARDRVMESYSAERSVEGTVRAAMFLFGKQ